MTVLGQWMKKSELWLTFRYWTVILYLFIYLHGLISLACSDSELTSEIINPFTHFDRIPWTGDQLIERPLHTQDSITQKTRT